MHSPLSIHPTKSRKKTSKERTSSPCELQSPRWDFQHGLSKLSLQQGCMFTLFGPIYSWLLRIDHQHSLSESASSSLRNPPSCIWIPHSSHKQFLGHEVPCFQLDWLCTELWRQAEALFSSHRHLHDSIQIKNHVIDSFPNLHSCFFFLFPHHTGSPWSLL